MTTEGLDTTTVTLTNKPPPLYRRLLRRAGREARGFMLGRQLLDFGAGSEVASPFYISNGSLISIGREVRIGRDARLEALDTGQARAKIRIGDGTKIHPGLHIGAVESVEIGRGVLMAANVYISDHDHDYRDPFDPVVSNGRVTVAPVHIGDFAWLGEQVMVLKGVTVGERSIVGAGSVVTRDVPPLSIVVGSPARLVRQYNSTSQKWEACAPASAATNNEPTTSG